VRSAALSRPGQTRAAAPICEPPLLRSKALACSIISENFTSFLYDTSTLGASSCRSVFASCKSFVSNPSVNQP